MILTSRATGQGRCCRRQGCFLRYRRPPPRDRPDPQRSDCCRKPRGLHQQPQVNGDRERKKYIKMKIYPGL